MRMRFIQNGVVAIPLYHGTSSAFVASIAAWGLGGRNIVKEFDLLPFLRTLLPVAEEVLGRDGYFREQYQAISEQRVSGMNWRHGGTYLTPSRLTARRYARATRGSELVAEILGLLSKIEASAPDRARLIVLPPGLAQLREHAREPVLVVVKDAPVDALVGELGQPFTEVVSRWEQAARDSRDLPSDADDSGPSQVADALEYFEAFAQQANVEVVQPVPRSHLAFFKVNGVSETPFDP